MAIKNDEKELHEIYKDVDSNKIVLPNFQRGFVWDRKKQRSLLASLVVGLPIGSLLLLDGRQDDFSKRRLCYPQELEAKTGDCQYVLDGQQRLSTLRVVLYDIFAEEDRWDIAFEGLYGPLRTRWFVRIIPEDGSEQDIFEYRTLSRVQLDRYIDSDIEDFIEYKVVHKNKAGEPYHPAYGASSEIEGDPDESAELRFSVAKAFAEEGLVPLWELSQFEAGLHRTVLEYIAENRIQELKKCAKLRNHSEEFYQTVFDPLSLAPGILKRQLSRAEQEGFNTALATQWAQLSTKWVESVAGQLESLLNRTMHYTHMTRDEVDRAVAVFEAINRGGTPLSVYDLIVAKSARDKSEKNLSVKIIEAALSEMQIPSVLSESFVHEFSENDKAKWSPSQMGVVEGNEPSSEYKNWFVNVLSLIVYSKKMREEIRVEHIKKEKHLSLSSQQVNENTSSTVRAINRALAFLQFRCGVVSASGVSYKLMLVVLAYYLYDDENWKDKSVLDKLEYWYWTSLLGGFYYARQNEKCIDDLKELELFLKSSSNRLKDRLRSCIHRPKTDTYSGRKRTVIPA